MNRLKKLLAAATLLVLPVIAACGEDVIPPPATGSIAGQVSIEGMGIDGVSVNLSNGASTTTAGGGTYRFDGVEAGAYTVTISGFPADASFDATSAAATIPETGGSVTLDFRGSYIRTASIMGTVTVENTGLGGVTVVLSGMSDATTATDMNGQYAFTGLRSGTYSVEISGFDSDEVGFGSLMSSATVGVGESKIISFDGTYLRTAGIMGQVSVEGVGRPNVTVTMTGEGEDMTDVTDAGGLYGFSKLKAGSYSVAISGYDPDEVEFGTTSMNVTIALGETANIPFEGTLLRTSGISGRVSVEGMGLDGVEVALDGAAVATAMTANGGQYAFAGLAEGTYVLTMTNPNADAYTFEMTSTNVVLGDSESNITNFEGTHTRTASVSGVLFIDEVMQDKMLTTGEPSLTEAIAPLVVHELLDQEMLDGLLANAKVLLRGPDLNTMTEVDINTDGTYTTGETLMAGSYQVELPANNEMVAAALAAAGVAFVGESAVVTVEAAGMATVNFPFRITMQTIGVGAVMGNDKETGPAVAGVELALYPTAQDAEAGTNMLSVAAETNEMGMAAFQFARADDSSPAGDASDNIVFVKVTDAGHADLEVSDNDVIEIDYPGVARVHSAPAHVRLLNTAVNFVFWVKNNEDARNGDEFLGGWATEVMMGKDTVPLMMVDEDGDTINATEPTDTAMATKGKGSFSYTVTAADLPATFTVAAAEKGQLDDGEVWKQSGALMLTHTGLELPLGEDDDMTDLGPIRITYTTQALYVGVHREVDDAPGYTDYRGGDGEITGDGRPSDELIEAELMYSETGGRLMRYEYKKFDSKGKREVEVANPMDVEGGMATFVNLPADIDFTVRIRAGSDRTAVTDRDVDAYDLTGADNRVVGAFGEGQSGARPDVWLCPQTDVTPADGAKEFKARCSTFGYQWTTGSVKVTVKNLRKDVKATVALEPVTDTHSEGDDKELKGTAAVGGAQPAKSHTFTGIQDGVYDVTLAGDGVGDPKPRPPLNFYHDEESEDEDYEGVVEEDVSFNATSLRAEIRGLVANNRIGRGRSNTLSGDEAGEDVTLTLHETKVSKGKIVIGDAVEDDDGDAVTATTNGDGEYVFENLEEKEDYFVQVTDCPGCEAYNDVDAKTFDFVDHASATAKVYDDDDENTPPEWNHEATTIGGVITPNGSGGFVNFAMVYTDGELSGAVTEPFDDVDRHRVELARCLTWQPPVVADDTAVPEVMAREGACDDYDENYEEATTTDKDGEWSADGLREGMYEVTVNPRGNFAVFVVVPGEGDESDVQSSVAEHTQYKPLDSGSGSAEEVDPVPIVNRSLGDEVLLTRVVITLGTRNSVYTVPDDGTGQAVAIGEVPWVTKSVDVAPEGSKGATFKVVVGAKMKTVGKGGVATLDLAAGVENTITITVIAANGYAESSDPVEVATVTRTAAQTAVGIASVAATYTNLDGTGNQVDTTTTAVEAPTDGVYPIVIDSTAVDGTDFTLTVTLAEDSNWAKVEYRVGGSGDYTEMPISEVTGVARVTRESGDIDLPDEGKSIDIQVKVTAQDGKKTNPYTVRVSQAAPDTGGQ